MIRQQKHAANVKALNLERPNLLRHSISHLICLEVKSEIKAYTNTKEDVEDSNTNSAQQGPDRE